MRFYELLYITRSDLTTAQLDDLNTTITNIIKDNSKANNKVVKVDPWGIKTLAYKSKKLKKNKGNYCLLKLSLEDYSVLKELTNRLKLNEAVLRFLIKQVDSLEDSTAQSQAKKPANKEAIAV